MCLCIHLYIQKYVHTYTCIHICIHTIANINEGTCGKQVQRYSGFSWSQCDWYFGCLLKHHFACVLVCACVCVRVRVIPDLSVKENLKLYISRAATSSQMLSSKRVLAVFYRSRLIVAKCCNVVQRAAVCMIWITTHCSFTT